MISLVALTKRAIEETLEEEQRSKSSMYCNKVDPLGNYIHIIQISLQDLG